MRSEVLQGIGSGGVSFNTNRWRELVFFITFLLKFKNELEVTRQLLMRNGDEFAGWLTGVPDSESRQMRHMLLFLLFPDEFERIFGGVDRRTIVRSFKGMAKPEIRRLKNEQIDNLLAEIRKEQELKHNTQELDFYIQPLNALWHRDGFDAQTADIESEHVIEAINEIKRVGVPDDAKSTGYDLIYEDERYPPKYVLSLACKYAKGSELDRSLFHGGEKSPAFKLLRNLGFNIEKKEPDDEVNIGELITRFITQADEEKGTAT